MHFCIKTDRKQKKRTQKKGKGFLSFRNMKQHYFFFRKKKIVVIIWTYLPGPYNHLGLYQAQSQCVSYTSPVRYLALPWIFLVFGTDPRFCFHRLFDVPNLKWKKKSSKSCRKNINCTSGIESRLPFRIFSTLHFRACLFTDVLCVATYGKHLSSITLAPYKYVCRLCYYFS